ncbi:MAG: DUF2207 domain-containing protein [Patescibacteria group bacterium]|jgi:hypothetical protein
MPDKIKDYWLVYCVAFLVLLVGLFPSQSQAADWAIENWQTDVTVTKDGICQFHEVRSYLFTGSVSEVAAQWPVAANSVVQDFTVLNEKGDTVVHEVRPVPDSNDLLRYNLSVPVSPGRASWQISYNATGCVSYFDNFDQLSWPLTTDTRTEIIDQLRVRVRLPRPAEYLDRFSQSLTIGTATGRRDLAGSRIIDSQTIEFAGSILPAKSSINYSASWPKEVLDDPGTLKVTANGVNNESISVRILVGGQNLGITTPYVFYLSSPTLNREVISLTVQHFGYHSESRELILMRGKSDYFAFELRPAWWYQPVRYGLAALVLVFWILPWLAWWFWYRRWRRAGRDPKISQIIKPELGPGQLTPSQVGVIVDERVDRRDLTAGLIFLAVHRYLAIERIDHSWSHNRKGFVLVKQDKNDQVLGTFERCLLQWIFEQKSRTTFSELAARMVTRPKHLSTALYDNVVALGYFTESPATVRRRYLRRPVNWLLITLALNIAALVSDPGIFVAVLPLLMASAVAVLFAGIMPKKTLKGAEVAHWSARYASVLYDQPQKSDRLIPQWEFERALPYLLVLEADAMWLSAYSRTLMDWPGWLRPIGTARPYSATQFVQIYNQLISASDAVFKTI